MHAGQVLVPHTSLIFFHSSLNDQQFEALRKRSALGSHYVKLKSSSVYFFNSELLVELMARSIFCSRFKRKERNHLPMFYESLGLTDTAPVANTFSTLSNLKSTLNRSFQVGIIQKCQETTHTYPFSLFNIGSKNPISPFLFRVYKGKRALASLAASPLYQSMP